MELWTAFLIGLAGSLHCVGMCGPIALALGTGETSRLEYLVGRVFYNIGRSVTYGLLGLAAGLVGQTVHVGGYQQGLSIALGVLLLLAILLPGRIGARITGSQLHARLTGALGRLWRLLSTRRSFSALLTIGMLNGFLPCGLVYVALAGAATTGQPSAGALYMLVFGLGTLPAMLAVMFAGRLVGTGLRLKLNRLVPVAGVMLAVLFILRGLSLGIPYVSPKTESDSSGRATMECHGDGEVGNTDALPADSSGR